MRYMQIAGGQKLHLVYEAGEGRNNNSIIKKGFLSAPICGRKMDNPHYTNGYRMTINVPLANACQGCLRVYRARYGKI